MIWNPYASAGAPAIADWTGGPDGASGVVENGSIVSVQASVYRNVRNLSASRITRLEVGGFLYGVLGHNNSDAEITSVPPDIVLMSVGGFGAVGFPADLSISGGVLQNLTVRDLDAIGSITCSGTASADLISVPNGSWIGSISANAGSLRMNVGYDVFAEIAFTGSAAVDQIIANGSILAAVSTVSGRIRNLIAGKDIGGSFSAFNANIESVLAGSPGFPGRIGVDYDPQTDTWPPALAEFTTGSLGWRIDNITAQSDILANITGSGTVQNVVSLDGNIGNASISSTIRSVTRRVDFVSAKGNVYSNIEALTQTTDPNFEGKVTRMVVGGDLIGNVSSHGSPTSIAVDGDVYGDITVNKGLSSVASILVGGEVKPGAEIVLNKSTAIAGSVGLAGQIIVNSMTAAGSLGGTVRVNRNSTESPIIVNTSDYEIAAATLGNGAVGVVPFKLYNTESTSATYNPNTPVTLGYYLDSRFVNDPPKIGFYGPVKLNGTPSTPGRTQPFKVEIVSADGTTFIDVTKRFKAVIDPTNNRIARLQYAPPSVHDFLMVGRYRITNVNPITSESLVCDLPGGSIVPVDMGAGLTFDIGRDCDGNTYADYLQIYGPDGNLALDTNRDGFLDSCVSPSSMLFCIADLNGDFFVNDADFQIFANAYNSLEDSTGDLNGDLLTNDADFSIFSTYYDQLDCAAYLGWQL